MRDIGAFFYYAENALPGYQAKCKKNDTMMDMVQTGNPNGDAVLIGPLRKILLKCKTKYHFPSVTIPVTQVTRHSRFVFDSIFFNTYNNLILIINYCN